MTTPFSLRTAALAASVLTLAACATAPAPAPAPVAAKPAVVPAAAAAAEYFVVLPEDGRMYAFGDKANYFQFLEHKEVALTRTRIGASPMGTTVVFGITNADVKGKTPSQAELMFDGKAPVASAFYGEVVKGGRYYVFSDAKVMGDFIQTGELPYSFTDIGAGPGGATVVWAVDKAGVKKGRPEATIGRFKALRQGQ